MLRAGFEYHHKHTDRLLAIDQAAELDSWTSQCSIPPQQLDDTQRPLPELAASVERTVHTKEHSLITQKWHRAELPG